MHNVFRAFVGLAMFGFLATGVWKAVESLGFESPFTYGILSLFCLVIYACTGASSPKITKE
jgi:hypothetical protein